MVAAYQGPLLRYVGRVLGSVDGQAEDLVQEAFLRLHRQLRRADGKSIERADQWLFRVAHNLCMDVIRRRGRQRKAQDHLAQNAADRSVAEDETLGRMMQSEAAATALDELERLPQELKHIVLLKVMQGMTLRQIARVTGMSLGSVNYRLNQALATLARRMKKRGVI